MNVSARFIPILFTICGGLLFAVFCACCIAKPDKLAAYARRRYSRSGAFTQKIPFARIVTKDWYSTVLNIPPANRTFRFAVYYHLGLCGCHPVDK